MELEQSDPRKMIDPLSVAGLTIAVLDTLIKLGERTAELLHDAGAFEEVRIHKLPCYL